MKALRKTAYKAESGENYGTPKEIWGFRTARSRKPLLSIARDFLEANAELFGIHYELEGLRFQKAIQSIGANHLIFQQQFQKRRVHRAYVTVHIARSGQVYLAKNRAAPEDVFIIDKLDRISKKECIQKARASLPSRRRRTVLQHIEQMWFPKDGQVYPAWRVRLKRMRPREEWIVYVDERTGRILSKYDNLAFGRGLVFDPSPVTALGGYSELLSAAGRELKPPDNAYRAVTLHGLGTSGYLTGPNVTTAATDRQKRIRRPSGRFLVSSHQRGFEEVMAYYHIDSAIRYLKRLGFRGRRGIFTEAVRVNARGTTADNSWYSPWEKTLTFGTGAIDDAEDGETILHELGHAIQDAICPDFGQSREAAAMGEGFGDYFAASFFADRKPEEYQTSVMTWDGLLIGLEEGRDPPCLRRVDSSKTYTDFVFADEHLNGEIWSATLWELREQMGAEMADRLIVESHFQQDGFTTFARGARAIIDGDRNLYSGRHVAALKQVFQRRKIGPV
jgi:hypothetical protein